MKPPAILAFIFTVASLFAQERQDLLRQSLPNYRNISRFNPNVHAQFEDVRKQVAEARTTAIMPRVVF